MNRIDLSLMKRKRVISNSETYAKRLKVCENCASSKRSASVLVCDVCGCFLKLKMSIAASKCPLGKW
jgi:hypothetical protein